MSIRLQNNEKRCPDHIPNQGQVRGRAAKTRKDLTYKRRAATDEELLRAEVASLFFVGTRKPGGEYTRRPYFPEAPARPLNAKEACQGVLQSFAQQPYFVDTPAQEQLTQNFRQLLNRETHWGTKFNQASPMLVEDWYKAVVQDEYPRSSGILPLIVKQEEQTDDLKKVHGNLNPYFSLGRFAEARTEIALQALKARGMIRDYHRTFAQYEDLLGIDFWIEFKDPRDQHFKLMPLQIAAGAIDSSTKNRFKPIPSVASNMGLDSFHPLKKIRTLLYSVGNNSISQIIEDFAQSCVNPPFDVALINKPGNFFASDLRGRAKMLEQLYIEAKPQGPLSVAPKPRIAELDFAARVSRAQELEKRAVDSYNKHFSLTTSSPFNTGYPEISIADWHQAASEDPYPEGEFFNSITPHKLLHPNFGLLEFQKRRIEHALSSLKDKGLINAYTRFAPGSFTARLGIDFFVEFKGLDGRTWVMPVQDRSGSPSNDQLRNKELVHRYTGQDSHPKIQGTFKITTKHRSLQELEYFFQEELFFHTGILPSIQVEEGRFTLPLSRPALIPKEEFDSAKEDTDPTKFWDLLIRNYVRFPEEATSTNPNPAPSSSEG